MLLRVTVLQQKPALLPTLARIRDVSTARRETVCVVKATGESQGQLVDWFPFGFIVCDEVTPKCPGVPSLAPKTTSGNRPRTNPNAALRPVKTTGMAWTMLRKSGLQRRAERCASLLRSVGLLGVNSARVTRMRYNTLVKVLVWTVPKARDSGRYGK